MSEDKPDVAGFCGKEFMDNPKYRWVIKLIHDNEFFGKDNFVSGGFLGNDSFVLKGHGKPPEKIVRGPHIWKLDCTDVHDGEQKAFYIHEARALQWDHYVSRKRRFPQNPVDTEIKTKTKGAFAAGDVSDLPRSGSVAQGYAPSAELKIKKPDSNETIDLDGSTIHFKVKKSSSEPDDFDDSNCEHTPVNFSTPLDLRPCMQGTYCSICNKVLTSETLISG